MDKGRLRYLIDASKSQEATIAEQQELDEWYASFDQESGITTEMNQDELDRKENILLSQINKEIDADRKVRPLWRKLVAAAMVFALVTSGLYVYFSSYSNQQENTLANVQIDDIPPGGNRAILTLADGTMILLRDSQSGIVIGNEDIQYGDGRLISNHVISTEAEKSVRMLTLETPKGGQYQVVLQDGTKVWLNAASSLTYPTEFVGETRRVVVSGEAYFEVAKNAKMPFIVSSKGQEIKVLGTHFNISAYDDEAAVKTTLVEGSVQVSTLSPINNTPTLSSRSPAKDLYTPGSSITLFPGEQSLLSSSGLTMKVADLETEIAWKNGDFIFKNDDIKSVMRKISRWYDADIEYEGEIGSIEFGGTVSRSKNISEVLRVLELTGAVHFKIVQDDDSGKGRRVIVMP